MVPLPAYPHHLLTSPCKLSSRQSHSLTSSIVVVTKAVIHTARTSLCRIQDHWFCIQKSYVKLAVFRCLFSQFSMQKPRVLNICTPPSNCLLSNVLLMDFDSFFVQELFNNSYQTKRKTGPKFLYFKNSFNKTQDKLF